MYEGDDDGRVDSDQLARDPEVDGNGEFHDSLMETEADDFDSFPQQYEGKWRLIWRLLHGGPD